MRESTTYQAILREGKAKGEAKGARRLLLRLGRKHLGPPAAEIEAKIQAMTEVRELEQLAERFADVSSWGELFDE